MLWAWSPCLPLSCVAFHKAHLMSVKIMLLHLMSLTLLSDAICPMKRHIEIYGPVGLRQLIRSTLNITGATLAGGYCVHEFLSSQTPISSCSMSTPDRHPNEDHGQDIQCDDDGKWRRFRRASGITISAAPLVHRGKKRIGFLFWAFPILSYLAQIISSLRRICIP